MRRTVRVVSGIGPQERLARAVAQLSPAVRTALSQVADRDDMPLVAGSWSTSDGGCLVANVVRTLDATGAAEDRTLDLRVLDLLPELSSRDLNRLIVAWDEAAAHQGRSHVPDEAAAQLGRTSDAALRDLLRQALARVRPLEVARA